MADSASQEVIVPSDRRRSVLAGMIVFVSVWASAGWYHQSRDWNTASRLMLVYALGDRGTISIDGLHKQTGDLAFKDGHYYSDKAPGYSLMAVPSYILGKVVFGWPSHPLGKDGFAHWPADAWVTWCTCGLAAAIIACVSFSILQRQGLTSFPAALAATMTVWASPLAVYATLAYGHLVASALFMTAAALVLSGSPADGSTRRPFLIGLAAGMGVLVELAQAPFAVAIGLCVILRDLRPKAMFRNAFAMLIGAMPAAVVWMVYNFLAFGSPFEMGYFYHATQQFAAVHSADNPLGLGRPDFSKLRPLVWGEYRGLLFYAPWAAFAVPGWVLMAFRKRWSLLWLTLAGFLVPLWVNLSYPEWTGGWSTGPRLLVPALPWLGLAAGYSLIVRPTKFILPLLYLWGMVVNSAFLSVGGRISQDIARPLRDAVLPIWTEGRLPPFWPGEAFARVVPMEWDVSLTILSLSQDARIWALGLFLLQCSTILIIRFLSGRTKLNQEPQARYEPKA